MNIISSYFAQRLLNFLRQNNIATDVAMRTLKAIMIDGNFGTVGVGDAVGETVGVDDVKGLVVGVGVVVRVGEGAAVGVGVEDGMGIGASRLEFMLLVFKRGENMPGVKRIRLRNKFKLTFCGNLRQHAFFGVTAVNS